MSMISSQCDKLRLIADKDTVPYEASDAMYQAADLILELRDGLQQANYENAKLIVKLNAEHIARQNVEIENAKLRELVRLMVRRHTLTRTCMDIPCGECPAKDECDQEDALMRELGIEVDE